MAGNERPMRLMLCTCLLAGSAAAAEQPLADAIYLNGDFLTGAALAGQQPAHVAALAVRDGRVLAAGAVAEVTRLKGPHTEVTDLHGAFALPGFNDAHLHLGDAGLYALKTDLRGVGSLEELKERIGESARQASPGAWLRGGGWDHTLWKPPRLPSRADLDAVTAGHPAVFDRIDGHIAVANSAALAALGVSRASPDPRGGRYDRDAQGELTGILRETAWVQFAARIPPPTPEQRRRGLEVALADAARNGLTSVQDYSRWDDFLVFEQLEREGKLPVRVSEWLTFNEPLEVLERERAHHAADDPMLHTGMLKGFMDGSLGSRTAALEAPYSDDPGNRGIPRYEQGPLNELTVARARAGFQIGFHAIGDRGVAMALTAFAAAEAALPPGQGAAARFRIEHDQVTTPADLKRQAALKVIASMQPSHLLNDMRWALKRLGPERARYAYAWKSMLVNGIPLAFGTDYPVETVPPLRGLYAAITRLPEPDAHVPAGAAFFPEERLTIGEALYAYTQGSAFAEKMETQKGTLARGQLADFVVLDRDLLRATPLEIYNARVLRTVVGGRTVYAVP
jgi:predicted amidohydrolase YtcJ